MPNGRRSGSNQFGRVIPSIAASFGRCPSEIRSLQLRTGGVRPAERRGSGRALRLEEREEISRGPAAGDSLRYWCADP